MKDKKIFDRGLAILSFFERSAEYLQELLEENEQLRQKLCEPDEDPTSADPDSRERLELHAQIQTLEAENRRAAARNRELEEEKQVITTLYVASYEMNAALDPDQALNAITEIVSGLIGARVFCIYLINESIGALVPLISEGQPVSAFPNIPLQSGPVGESVESGEISTYDSNASAGSASVGAQPIVCIPIRVEEKPVGAIAIYRLLRQKTSFAEVDHELFRLLAKKAATAILASQELAQAKRRWAFIKGTLDLVEK